MATVPTVSAIFVDDVLTNVQDAYKHAQDYQGQAFNTAQAMLNTLSGVAGSLGGIPYISDQGIDPTGVALKDYVSPTPPILQGDLQMNVPGAPQDPGIIPVSNISVGNAPQFTAQSPAVDFSFAPPLPLTATVPLAPSLPTVAIPSAPTITLPDPPTIIGITVPVEPMLNFPVFSALIPNSPLAPGVTFSFAEPTYTSQLLTDLRANLDTWVNGTYTGLPPVVEQAIWDRGRSREYVGAGRKIKEAIRTFATRGFTKPPGALSMEIQSALQDTQDALNQQSREVAINQANLEQTNRRFAFEEAFKVEEMLVTYQNQIAQRGFEAAKFVQQIAVDIYHENVANYSAQVQAYSAQVEQYKVAILAELNKLEIYKAEIQAQQLISQINQQAVETYRARVEAVGEIVNIFRAQVEAANTAALVNKTIIEGFAAQVQAYAETVHAKAVEYDGYATRVRAEVAKVDVFRAQSDAYRSQVEGFKATVDAAVAAKQIELDVSQRIPLDLFKTRTEVFRSQVEAESARVTAATRVQDTLTQVFSAEVQGATAQVTSNATNYRSAVELAQAKANIRIEAARANIQQLIEKTQALIEAVRGGAQTAAQLAAAAMSSINMGMHAQHTNSTSAVEEGIGEDITSSSSSTVNHSSS